MKGGAMADYKTTLKFEDNEGDVTLWVRQGNGPEMTATFSTSGDPPDIQLKDFSGWHLVTLTPVAVKAG
jgi:hypothetical protein